MVSNKNTMYQPDTHPLIIIIIIISRVNWVNWVNWVNRLAGLTGLTGLTAIPPRNVCQNLDFPVEKCANVGVSPQYHSIH